MKTSESASRARMENWHPYPAIYNLGHRCIADLLTVPVIVEENVDGSQFSFAISREGELRIRSKGALMYAAAPENDVQARR